jgi:hypothetical protein
MDNKPAIYKNKVVSKENFRVYIYGKDGARKLVNSWDEYFNHISSGLWLDERLEKKDEIVIDKPKRKTKKNNENEVILKDEPVPLPHNDLAFEVKNDDDFLPKEGA